MRKIIIALSAIAFTAGVAGVTIPAEAAKAPPAKTKLGCIKGKEKWNAGAGKCEASKPVKKATKKA
jgi:hypothetical protein